MQQDPAPYIEQTGIHGLLVLNPPIYTDERGYFFESYNRRLLENHGLFFDFVQDNQAFSKYGVVRGLHYQLEPYAQAKLVRVTQGLVYDVAVDLRGGSPTFGKWFGIMLSDQNKKQLLVPRGFAHGYAVLSPTAEFVYKCDNYYSKEHEAGIVYNDPLLNINWHVPQGDMIVSEKDRMLAFFTDARYNFTFSE